MIVDVVAGAARVAAGEDEDRAQTVAAVGDRVLYGSAHARERGGLEVIGEEAVVLPAVVRDVDGCLMLQGIENLTARAFRAVADAEARDLGVGGDAHRAVAVAHLGGDHAGDGGAVNVKGIAGIGVAVLVAGVVVQGVVVIIVEILMQVIDPVVYDADDDALARVVVPDGGDVDVVSGAVVQVPLPAEFRIVRDHRGLGPDHVARRGVDEARLRRGLIRVRCARAAGQLGGSGPVDDLVQARARFEITRQGPGRRRAGGQVVGLRTDLVAQGGGPRGHLVGEAARAPGPVPGGVARPDCWVKVERRMHPGRGASGCRSRSPRPAEGRPGWPGPPPGSDWPGRRSESLDRCRAIPGR